MSDDYEVVKEGWLFDGHRFHAGDPISLDVMERAGRGKTGSFLRLGIIRERPKPRRVKKPRKTIEKEVDE